MRVPIAKAAGSDTLPHEQAIAVTEALRKSSKGLANGLLDKDLQTVREIRPMSDDEEKRSKEEKDAELLRESLVGRKFTIAEAIGRLAGPGMMKGVSPITGKEQADVVIQEYLRFHLVDSGGALSCVLLRRVKESELLLAGFEQPLVVLARYLEQVLGSDFRLKELVREADSEWGRAFGERPYFERDGSPADADDPYTLESVRIKLTQLADGLAQGSA